MKTLLRRHFVVVLAFVLPFALIIIVAASIYLPSFLLSTSYNFIYATCDAYTSYPCDNYAVVDNKLVARQMSTTLDSDKVENYSKHIFLYDTKKNESSRIVLVEAQSMTINGLATSPDGVTVRSERGRIGGFSFFSEGYFGYVYYLTKGNRKNKLHIKPHYREDNFHFIGWVLQGR